MFQSAGAAAFFAAWKGLCLNTPIPHYREVFQSLSTEMIPRLIILEEAGDQHIIRFMGTLRTEVWGKDLTGTNALALMKPGVALAARRNMHTMCEHPCGMYHMSHYITPTGREVHMENVTVPVGNDPGLPRRLLNFIEEISMIAYGEPRGEILGATQRTWLDIGAGIPKKAPAK